MSRALLAEPRIKKPQDRPGESSLEAGALYHRNLEVDRRIEDWLVCYLEDTEISKASASFADISETGSLEKAPSWTPARPAPPKTRDRLALTHDWARIDIRRKGSVVVVRLLDRMLIKEGVVTELSDELADVLDTGNRRIILSFGNVERMSSTIVAVLVKAHRRCADAPGGMLKVCGLHEQVADVFMVAGLPGIVPIFADEAAAMKDPWPSRVLRPLPFSILSAIAGPGSDSAPSAEAVKGRQETVTPAWPGEGPLPPDESADEQRRSSVWLVVERGDAGGPRRGDVIVVSSFPFLIGRGPECDLRLPGTIFEAIHALIERQGAGVFFRDTSREGTLINSRAPARDRTRLKNGDRIQLGPLCLSVVIGADLRGHRRIEDLVASWLIEWNERQAESEIDPAEDGPSTEVEIYTFDEASASAAELQAKIVRGPLWLEVIQDVLVVTPRLGRLDEDKAVEQLREALGELFTQSLPRRVVLKLDHVTHISSRALGVLLAYYLRLSRDGGALRICNLHARVFSLIEQLRLPVLLELCSTVEEAVITSWD